MNLKFGRIQPWTVELAALDQFKKSLNLLLENYSKYFDDLLSGERSLPFGLLVAYAKTKTQISFAVTAKLISAFVFAIRIVHSLYSLYPKFQASSHLLWLYSPVCVGPGRKPRRPVFSERGSYLHLLSCMNDC